MWHCIVIIISWHIDRAKNAAKDVNNASWEYEEIDTSISRKSLKSIENYEEMTMSNCVAYGEISASNIEETQIVLESSVYEIVQWNLKNFNKFCNYYLHTSL